MRVTNNTYILSGGNYSGGDYGTLGNVYGMRTPQGMVLVDCGLPGTGRAMIEETMAYYGLQDPITHVILTHAHVDHCGNAKHYQEQGAKIVAGRGDVDYLCEAGGFNLFGDTRVEEGTYHIFDAFTPDITIEEDCEREINGLRFRFITIPGHTVGSLAIWLDFEGKTMLFTGDSIYPMGINCEEVSLGWRGDPRYSSKDFIASLKKLVGIECDMVLPGHGNICVRNGTQVVRRAAKAAFHELHF